MGFISFMEIAKLYFPLQKRKSATNSLSRWIKRCPDLSAELKSLGFKTGQRLFTPRMVNRIYYHFGEP